jgi:hypothetical protein
MKRLFQYFVFGALCTDATLFAGCDAASLAGPDEAPRAQQDCDDDSCSSGHNL